MQIKRNELNNRVYDGRHCIGFSYTLHDCESSPIADMMYKLVDGCKEWEVSMVVRSKLYGHKRFYSIKYSMPKDRMPIEVIAESGMMHIQDEVKSEIAAKSVIDFSIGDVLSDAR